MDQLLAMRAFVTAVKCSNLGQAAEQLGVSRTLVSRQIQALEKSINANLMIRTTRSLTLTSAGEKYFLFCEEALAEIDEMDAQMRAENSEVRGELPVLCPKWMAEPVAQALAEFVKLHPEIQPTLVLESLPLTAYEFLTRGCEVSFTMRSIPDSRIVARKLFELPFILCGSPEFLETIEMPEHPADLKTLPSLVQSAYPYWNFTNGKTTERVFPRNVFSANSYVALRSAALTGIGLSAIPMGIVEADIARGDLEPVMTNWSCKSEAIFVSFAPGETSPVRAQAFARFAADWFRANPL